MKIMKYIFITLFMFITIGAFADGITIQEAQRTAKNLYFEKTGINQNEIIFEQVYTQENKGFVDYYIFDVKGENGFVIVSAEDGYNPIIGYSTTGIFVNENQPENVKYWMNTYVKQIDYIRENNIIATADIKQSWQKYNVAYNEFIPQTSTKGVDALVGDILWNQDGGWNEFCPEDAAGPNGHVYVGCVATAMGIILKYNEYPIHGTGSHSYWANGYGTQTVDYANASYFWSLMQNDNPNQYSALLLYHLGVSVNMGYSADGSGAFSFNVPDALSNYFNYNSAQYKDKGDYTQTAWINLMKGQIDASHPVYYSGRDDDNGGHAFVCSGYDDSDNFHFNFGWSGYNNGYYSVSDVGGFHNGQAAVINIYPSSSATYPNAPQNLTATLDLTNTSDFVVDLAWDSPATKGLAGYTVYRDFDEIANLEVSDHTYTDTQADPGSYDYSVRAIYTDGESLVASDPLSGEFDITFNFVDGSGTAVNMATATLTNGGSYDKEIYSSFLSYVTFTKVLWGGNFSVEVSRSGYSTITENIPFNNHEVNYTFVLGEGLSSINNVDNNSLNIYPNPSTGTINVNIENANNSTITVNDITGKQVFKTADLKEGNNTFVFTNLKKGLYILKYINRDIVVAKSFIIE